MSDYLEHKFRIPPINDNVTDEEIIEEIGLKRWNELHHFQKECIRFIIRRGGRGLISLEQGLGKTLTALLIALRFIIDLPLLFITTKSNLSGIYAEVLKWLPISEDQIHLADDKKQRRNIKYLCTCVKVKKQRIIKKQKVTADSRVAKDGSPLPCDGCVKKQYQKTHPPPKTYLPLNKLINIIAHDAAKLRINEIRDRKFKFIIIDECTKITGLESKMSELLIPICIEAKRCILLSGLPMTKPFQLIQPIRAIQPSMFPDKEIFIDKFCNPRVCNNKDGSTYKNITGSSNRHELNELLNKHIMFRWTKDQEEQKCIQEGIPSTLPQKIRKCKKLLLPFEQEEVCQRQLKEWKDKCDEEKKSNTDDKMVNNINSFYERDWGSKGRSPSSSSSSNKKNDNTTNGMYSKMNSHLSLVKRKLIREQIKKVLDTIPSDKKMIFWADRKETMKNIASFLRDNHVTYIYIDGSTKNKDRAKLILDFQQDNSPYKAAVFSLRACCEGITLTKASYCYFCELIPNPKYMLQAEDRIHRLCQKSPQVYEEYWVIKNSVDEFNWDKIFYPQIYNANTILDKRKLKKEEWVEVTTELREEDDNMETQKPAKKTNKKRKHTNDDEHNIIQPNIDSIFSSLMDCVV